MSEEAKSSESEDDITRLERLRCDALNCLETFPSKVIELNEIIEEYTPECNENIGDDGNTSRPEARLQSTLPCSRDYKLMIPEINVTSYYSLSTYDRSRARRGICKRKYYRRHAINGSTNRRHPGPLGRLLAFIVGRLAICTKKLIFAPSSFIVDNIVSVFFRRRELKNAQCGPSSNWDSSVSSYMTNPKKDDTIIGNLINVTRPLAVQLINDATILKRWLQALVLANGTLQSNELANAIRTTEIIDCWAYELFFHLKYLQVERARQHPPEKATTIESKSNERLTQINLWHRIIQLRNNYIIMYDALEDDEKIRQSRASTKQRLKQ